VQRAAADDGSATASASEESGSESERGAARGAAGSKQARTASAGELAAMLQETDGEITGVMGGLGGAAESGDGGGAGGMLEQLNFNLIPAREFGLQMIRMPG